MVRVLLASDPCHWQRLLESMTAEQLQRWCCQNCVVEFVAFAYCMYFFLELSKLRTSQKSVLKACTKSQSVHSHTCIGTTMPFPGRLMERASGQGVSTRRAKCSMQSRSSVEEMNSLPKMTLGCKFIWLMSFTAACQHQVAAIIVGVLPSRNFPRL